MKFLLILITVVVLSASQKVQYQWNYLNFTWPSTASHNQALQDGSYVPENTIITGIKVWKDRLYLTLPRWKTGVPVTLATTSIIQNSGDISPLLEPYPSWEMQQLDDCRAFQFVQSMEIDPQGRMWVLENGRTEFLIQPRTKCPTRLVVLDLERNGQVLLDYVFPAHVVNKDSVFINDIVLDHEDGGWAYITDNDSKFPGIIVFSLKDKTSWKVTHPSMNAEPEATQFIVNGTVFTVNGPVDGIALSPASTEGNRVLYYTPLASYEIFTVPVQVLKCPALYPNINAHVQLLGRKPSQTDGMMVSAAGTLYLGFVTADAIASWNVQNPAFPENFEIIAQNSEVNQWPDTFAMDEFGQLWWTSNRIQNFMNNKVNLNEVNYRVIVIRTPTRSYQYYSDGTYPELPKSMDFN